MKLSSKAETLIKIRLKNSIIPPLYSFNVSDYKKNMLISIGNKIKNKFPKFQFMGLIKLTKDDYNKLKAKIIVYSSYSSDIIKNRDILQKKQFIHCHPGKLPYFRGSAVYYYSLLIKKTIYYTTFILNHKIDDG